MSYYNDYDDDIKKLEEYYEDINNEENDPDLDERFPSLDEIYRKDNLIEFNHITKQVVFKHLDTVIDTIINDKKFQEFVFNENVLDLKSIAFTRIISLMKQCAIELLDKMLQVLGGIVDRNVLNDLAGACLSLSIKLYGSYDWIYSENVLNGIFYKARDEGIILNSRLMNIMERDIMKNTDWKGCPTFYLEKTYDPMFQDQYRMNSRKTEKKSNRKTEKKSNRKSKRKSIFR